MDMNMDLEMETEMNMEIVTDMDKAMESKIWMDILQKTMSVEIFRILKIKKKHSTIKFTLKIDSEALMQYLN